MMTKHQYNILTKMKLKFNHDGYTYFCDGFTAFRHRGILDECKLLKDDDNATVIVPMFTDPLNRYSYQLAEKQPTTSSLTGKKTFLFGHMKQLVNATYIRNVWKIMGSKSRFYLSSNHLYPVFVNANNDWEAVIMPMRYNPDTYVEKS